MTRPVNYRPVAEALAGRVDILGSLAALTGDELDYFAREIVDLKLPGDNLTTLHQHLLVAIEQERLRRHLHQGLIDDKFARMAAYLDTARDNL